MEGTVDARLTCYFETKAATFITLHIGAHYNVLATIVAQKHIVNERMCRSFAHTAVCLEEERRFVRCPSSTKRPGTMMRGLQFRRLTGHRVWGFAHFISSRSAESKLGPAKSTPVLCTVSVFGCLRCLCELRLAASRCGSMLVHYLSTIHGVWPASRLLTMTRA